MQMRSPALIWAPRIAGLCLAAFLAMFALDAFSQNQGILSSIVGTTMGLIPAVIALITVLIGWKREGIAAILFFAGALFYAVTTREHPGWVATISAPLILVGLLFTLSWRAKRS
jgi:hypothetical protein